VPHPFPPRGTKHVVPVQTDPATQAVFGAVQSVSPTFKVVVGATQTPALQRFGLKQKVVAVARQFPPIPTPSLQVSSVVHTPAMQFVLRLKQPLSPRGTLHDPSLH
jgi:hypothetical protein